MFRKLVRKSKRFKLNVKRNYFKNGFKNKLNECLNISLRLFVFEMKTNVVKIVKMIMYAYITQKNERINIYVLKKTSELIYT